MSKKISGEDAKRILSDCMPEQCFWVNNGPVLKNLNELSSSLKSISDDQFTHHMNTEKNDFSKWVAEVIGDAELSKALSNAKSRTAAIKKINKRIESLKRVAG